MSGGEVEERFDGLLIKVLEVIDDGNAFFGRLANGNTARFSLGTPADLDRGDLVLVGDDWWHPAPTAVWPDDSMVGIIRKRIDDGFVVEIGTTIKVVRGTPLVSVDVGNTVELNDVDGITNVIASTPLRFRDAGVDEDLSEYLVKPGASELDFDSFGGYGDVIERAKELIETQLDLKEDLERIGAQPVKGVIFTGPPGTGKTHLARIIANVSNARFYLVSGPSIVSKWVGDSEETLRRLFEDAAKQERAIIFFDEIDSIAARRAHDSHGESKRVVAQLLTLLDGFETSSNIVVIAATNRIDDIDEALLRPGRFDWEIEFRQPNIEDRFAILMVRAQQLQTSGQLPLEELALATEGWSGAMLTAIWTEAALIAASDHRPAIADEDLAQAYERVRSRPVHSQRGSQHVN
ncbi:MAG: ATP-binding protein [Acidimicrobiales bacterium]